MSGLVLLLFLSVYAAAAFIMNLMAGPSIYERLMLVRENGRIYSRKRNHEEGIGIASMKEIVQKYDGLCRFESSGGKFEASFLLNMPEGND